MDQPIINASVFIICVNAEKTIARALESVRSFADIVVVDSGSTDRTLEIAQGFDCRIYRMKWMGYARQKQYAMAHCQQPWALSLDVDEQVSPSLLVEIRQFLSNPINVEACSVPIHEVFCGKPKNRWTHKEQQIRFVERSKAQVSDVAVHEAITVSGKVQKFRASIRHYGNASIAIQLAKYNRYATLQAVAMYREGKKGSIIKLCLVFPITFIKSYIFHREFFNGWRGLVASILTAFHLFLREAILIEAQKRKLVVPDKTQ